MNYYLVPKEISEKLGLTRIRKSTDSGMYLLSERDLLAYGLAKAVDEGAIVLSSGNGGIAAEREETRPEEAGASAGQTEADGAVGEDTVGEDTVGDEPEPGGASEESPGEESEEETE